MKVIASTRLAKAQKAMGVAQVYGASNNGKFLLSLPLPGCLARPCLI